MALPSPLSAQGDQAIICEMPRCFGPGRDNLRRHDRPAEVGDGPGRVDDVLDLVAGSGGVYEIEPVFAGKMAGLRQDLHHIPIA